MFNRVVCDILICYDVFRGPYLGALFLLLPMASFNMSSHAVTRCAPTFVH